MSKNKKNPVYHLKESDIKKLKREVTQSAVDFSNIIFLSVMRDKEGYGVKRLKRLYDRIQDLVDSFNRGYVSIYDLKKTLEEESGIVIAFGNDGVKR